MRPNLLAAGTVAAAALSLAACGRREAEAGTPPAAQQTAMNAAAPADAPVVTVYKSPTCGCCGNWVRHMQENGFRVDAHDVASNDSLSAVKAHAGVPPSAASCHTGLVGGYAIEGHVPADVIRRLLREHPSDVVGLAVPGMVSGSPGMEGPDPQHFDVIAFTRDGKTRVYESR